MSDYNTKRRARNEKCVDSVTDAKKSVKKKVGRKLKFAYFTLTGLSAACFLCACITHVEFLRISFFRFSDKYKFTARLQDINWQAVQCNHLLYCRQH